MTAEPVVSGGLVNALVWALILLPALWLFLDGLRWLVGAGRRAHRRGRARLAAERHPAGAWRQSSHVRIVRP